MRLDQALVQRGLIKSRARAHAAIADGLVAVDGQVTRKPSHKVAENQALTLVGTPLLWVSRAAQKLVHALDVFGISPQGLLGLDIGASTGGFSEVLLDRGARHVVAIDVGHGQCDPGLAAHPRLTYLEGVNARDIAHHDLPRPEIVVSDVSFISLTKALPPALNLAQLDAELVALIKPQFEFEPALIGKGDIVKKTADREFAVTRVSTFLHDMGWPVQGITPSPIEGSDGNIEFLVYARKTGA